MCILACETESVFVVSSMANCLHAVVDYTCSIVTNQLKAELPWPWQPGVIACKDNIRLLAPTNPCC